MITLHPPNCAVAVYRPTDAVEDARLHLSFLRNCQAAGLFNPSDENTANAWISGFREALMSHEQLPDPCAGHVLSTGATALHILACMLRTNSGYEEIIAEWLDRVGQDRSRTMGSQADCSGRTPFGLALAADLEATMGYCNGAFGGTLRALAERGLVGANGEAGSILLGSMERQGLRLNGTGALHMLPLHQVIEACRRHGIDWLVPLSTPKGMINDRGVAIGIIMNKLDRLVMKSELRAGFEALLLGDQIQTMGKGSLARSRL